MNEPLKPVVNQLTVETAMPIFWADLSHNPDQLLMARQAIDELRAANPETVQSNVKSAPKSFCLSSSRILSSVSQSLRFTTPRCCALEGFGCPMAGLSGRMGHSAPVHTSFSPRGRFISRWFVGAAYF